MRQSAQTLTDQRGQLTERLKQLNTETSQLRQEAAQHRQEADKQKQTVSPVFYLVFVFGLWSSDICLFTVEH